MPGQSNNKKEGKTKQAQPESKYLSKNGGGYHYHLSSFQINVIDIQQDPNQDQQHTNHQEQINQIICINEDNRIIQINHNNEDNCIIQINHHLENIKKFCMCQS